MMMSDGEILREYNAAKNKGEQARILADLNQCSFEDIKRALRRAGVTSRQLPRAPRTERTNSEEDQMEEGFIKVESLKESKETTMLKESNIKLQNERDELLKENKRLSIEVAELREKSNENADDKNRIQELETELKEALDSVAAYREQCESQEKTISVLMSEQKSNEDYNNLLDEYNEAKREIKTLKDAIIRNFLKEM